MTIKLSVRSTLNNIVHIQGEGLGKKREERQASQKPAGFENDLGDFGPVLFDGYCGEPVAWGFRLLRQLGENRYRELEKIMRDKGGEMKATGHGGSTLTWVAVSKYLSPAEAIEAYGKIKSLITGPKGGFKRVTFGEKTFCCKALSPSKAGITVPLSLTNIE